MVYLMEKSELIKIIKNCFKTIKERDHYLFEINIHEDAFNHRLATLLSFQFETNEISVDTEYNRHYNELKTYGLEGKSAIVDIVIHERGTDNNNLIAFECKKKAISSLDLKKIEALIGPEFNYQFGVTIQYFSGLATIYFINSEGNFDAEEVQL